MRKLAVVFAISLAIGAFIGLRADPTTFEGEVVRADARQTLDLPAETVDALDPAVVSTLLSYADDQTLLFNARAALARYPRKAERVIGLYGREAEFQAILHDYGASVIPPIHYYLEHDSYALNVMRYTAEQIERANDLARRLWSGETQPEPERVVETGTGGGELTPELRGWYAVNFIREEGHDFLGQFVVDADGEVQRVQFERVIEGTAQFFTSGVRTLEQKYRRDEPITAGDYAWAGVDLAIMAGAVKVLRAGKAAATGTRAGVATARAGTATARSGLAARALARTGRIGLRIAKYGAIPATIVLAVTHPTAVTGLLFDAASALGVSPTLTVVGGWTLLLLPLVFVGMTLMKWLVRPAIGLLRGLRDFLRWLERGSWRQRNIFSEE